jgi:hypothetical protein
MHGLASAQGHGPRRDRRCRATRCDNAGRALRHQTPHLECWLPRGPRRGARAMLTENGGREVQGAGATRDQNMTQVSRQNPTHASHTAGWPSSPAYTLKLRDYGVAASSCPSGPPGYTSWCQRQRSQDGRPRAVKAPVLVPPVQKLATTDAQPQEHPGAGRLRGANLAGTRGLSEALGRSEP